MTGSLGGHDPGPDGDELGSAGDCGHHPSKLGEQGLLASAHIFRGPQGQEVLDCARVRVGNRCRIAPQQF